MSEKKRESTQEVSGDIKKGYRNILLKPLLGSTLLLFEFQLLDLQSQNDHISNILFFIAAAYFHIFFQNLSGSLLVLNLFLDHISISWILSVCFICDSIL